MKKISLPLLLISFAQITLAQQWTGSSDVNGVISRNGNITVNGLYYGRYGSALSGDSNPYLISSSDNENHDLTIFGSNAATLHLRMYDGDIKLGSYSNPNSIIYNNGGAYFIGYVGIGTTSPGSLLHLKSGTFETKFIGGNQIDFTRDNANYITASNISGFLSFGTGGRTQDITLNAEGKVGIGTSTPAYKLDVTGNLRTTSFINAYEYITVQNANSQGQYRVAMNGQADGYFKGRDASNNDKFVITSNGTSYLNGGNVGIGTTNPDAALTVKGTIHAQQVNVDLNGSVAPDYVFEPDYKLLSLEELKSYIEANKHLPDVPPAKEIEAKGINVSEMNLLLLRKIEELTLHVIELKNENDRQNKIIQELTSTKK